MTFKQSFYLLIVLFVCQTGFSQRIPLSFRQLTIDDGLSCNNVEHIVEDSLGYLWFGGPQGLNRYDGYEIRNYYSSVNDSTSLPDNQILSLFCDSSGRLWVGTYNGIAAYCHERDHFVVYDYFDDNRFQYNARLVNFIEEDEHGVIWFASENGLFFAYDEQKDQFVYRELALDFSMQVKSFYFDEKQEDILWIGANIGLIKYNLAEDEHRLFPLPDLPGINPLSLNVNCVLPDGPFLWLGVYRMGIVRFDCRNQEFKLYRMKNENENYILSGTLDSNNNLWFATGGGLFLYDEENDKFHKYGYSPHNAYGLNVSGIAAFFEDSNQNYWVGTSFGGVNYSWGPQNFRSYEIDPHQLRNIPEKSINSFSLDHSGFLWVAYANGIDVFDKNSMELANTFSSDDGSNDSLGSGTVWDIVEDSENRLWVSTYTGGLQKFDKEKHVFTSYPNFRGGGDQQIGQDIRDIFIDDSGDLWLAMHGHGFSRFDIEKERFYNFRIDENRGYLDWTYCIHVDHLKRVWIGTTSGLFKFTPDLQQYQEFIFDPDDATSLSYNTVNTIFQDSDNNIWIGTRRGLNLYDEDMGGFRRFGIEDGLINDNICSIQEDDFQNLWVSTRGGGIFSFSREKLLEDGTLDPRFFDKEDGLNSDEFVARASFQDDEGYLYFGGINGFTVFHPDSIEQNPREPDVIIQEIKLFDEIIYPSAGSPVYMNEKTGNKELQLKYNQNVLSFKFTAFNFRQPGKNEYLYKLEGFDDRWYSAGTDREAVYTNLPAGDFTFRVKASNNDGVWNEEGAIMQLTVFPPWWQTPLFHFSLAFFFVGVIYLFFLWRVKAIKRQRNYLEKMVTKKTAQLEHQNREIQEMAIRVHEADQSKIRFFMNISHEFRTPLSLIIGPLSRLLARKDFSTDIRTQLQIIDRSARRLMRLINQLLDMQKVEFKKLLLKVSQVNVFEFMRSIFYLFEFTAREKSISYSFHFDEILKTRILWLDVDALEKIVYNLLSNAFKYTQEGGQVDVRVRWLAEDGKLRIEVEDSGAGIPEDKLPYVFERYFSHNFFGGTHDGIGIGLTLVKELVELHKGQIWVQSQLEKGTVFILELPAREENFSGDEVRSASGLENSVNREPAQLNISLETTSLPQECDVLLVEDDDDLLNFLKNDLSGNYAVHAVNNGDKAWRECRHLVPDIVVSDIMMPGTDGVELCRKIKTDEELGHIPVILLTAKTEDYEVMEGYETGADDYITKPFNPDLLKIRISNLVQTRKKLRAKFDYYTDIKQDDKSINSADNLFLDRAISFVEKNISDPSLGHKELASALNVGKTSLYKKISDLTGYSTNVFIRIIRLKGAAIILREGGSTVSEVAYKVGFNDPNYFSKCFKEFFQVAPTEYK